MKKFVRFYYRCSLKVFLWAVLSLIGLTVLSSSVFATPLQDTGLTKCYDNNQQIPCPQPGQPFYGQDAQYGPNLQSYADLGNGVIRDNITGLMWQQDTAPGIYTWQQALYYSASLSLGSYDDWRLPTIRELSTIVDSSIPYPSPTINATYFTNTVADYYWSSTISVIPGRTNYSWCVRFTYGSVSDCDKDSFRYVRAVRGGQPTNNFIDNGDGTISDTSSGLMWQKATASGTYTWEQALNYCENLTLPAGGYSDWRLPNRNELQWIVDYSKSYPAIDTTFFPDTMVSNYWSSTSWVDYTYNAKYVAFAVGNLGANDKSRVTHYVRAVRDIPTTTTTTQPSTTTTSVSLCGNGVLNPGEECEDDGDCNLASGEWCNYNTCQCESPYDCSDDGLCDPSLFPGVYFMCIYCDYPGVCTAHVGDCVSGEQCAQWAGYGDPAGWWCDECDICEYDGSLCDSDANCPPGYICNDRRYCEPEPTLITLSSFTAKPGNRYVALDWETASEIDTIGFNIFRSESEYANYERVNPIMILSQGSVTQSASYEFIDKYVKNRKTYYYKLEDIDLRGKSTMHGPVSAMPRLIFGILRK
jgi:hypothetical protein